MLVLFTFVALFISISSFHSSFSFKNGAIKKAMMAVSSNIVNVDLGDRSYPIYISQGLLKGGDELRKHVKSKKALIVTNTKVGPLYSYAVMKALEGTGVEVHEVVLPDGEEYKTMEYLMMIIDAAMGAKLDRKSTMIALGGGVIGDMCGFAASIYQRGIKFVQVPTTLMAMVDSAVGGKTAVNHPLGKNMIGQFYQPDAVIVDTLSLDSLPDRELCSGVAEVIKYGLIRDPELFEWLEKNMEKVLSRDKDALAHIVKRSCENKAEVVALDEKEGGIRATLNLGHTFGHAIESGLGYGTWLHGEAVGTGILMAADFSYRMKMIDKTVLKRTKDILIKAKLPISLDFPLAKDEIGDEEYKKICQTLSVDKFLNFMSMDKKVADGQLSLILLENTLGNCIITNKFDSDLLKETVSDYCMK